MKIGNATANWQTTTPQRSSSRGGSFAEQLQQATQAQSGTDSSDPRALKMRQIVGKYDLDNLSFNQSAKMFSELFEAGIISSEQFGHLLPVEATLTDGGVRSKEELDHIMVDPRERAAIGLQQSQAKGDPAAIKRDIRILEIYDELLASYHDLKSGSRTVSTRA